ncbi:Hypothetical predicted protein [Paramuricea clavata]|uniref:Uncharacterized protein n=1 Tax=Paramuricea clavata TaxID=317549 RepID=A0A6S7FN88_PARCT|nr:Hypothetical predicted protein [Paramuricea clavata]
MASGTKRDMAIQHLGEGEKDHPPTHKELFLFFQEMNEWERLDERLVAPMQEIQAESVRMAEDGELSVIVTQMLRLAGLSNSVANCSRHTIGCMVRAVHERHVDDDGNEERRIRATLNQLQDNLEAMQYDLYVKSLEDCGCDDCTACVQFDKAYNA